MEKRWSRKKRTQSETAVRHIPEAVRVDVQDSDLVQDLPEQAQGAASDNRRQAEHLLRAFEGDQSTARRGEDKRKTAAQGLPVSPAPDHGQEPEPKPDGQDTAATRTETLPAPAANVGLAQSSVQDSELWQEIPRFPVDVKHMEKNRIITAERSDPAHSAFDILRTKLLRTLKENGWTRIAVTSPTEGCGKTFMAVNLAISLSRQANCRTVLVDLDMRRPSVAKVLGIDNPGSMGDFLRGETGVTDLLRKAGQNDFKIGDNIAIAPNGRREDYASELMQLPETAAALNELEARLSPDVVIFDMPPALVNDDVLAARPLFDGVLLIVGGGLTKPQQVRDVERRLGTETPLLGIVLNRSEGEAAQSYNY